MNSVIVLLCVMWVAVGVIGSILAFSKNRDDKGWIVGMVFIAAVVTYVILPEARLYK